MEQPNSLKQLRSVLSDTQLDGWLVPRSDEHQGEYVAEYAQRLAKVTGFTGSAGMAIILRDKAAVFVDGRYTLQAEKEVDSQFFEVILISEITPAQWLSRNTKGLRIGYDPWLHTESEIERYQQGTRYSKVEFIPHTHNLIDEIWQDQPAKPTAEVMSHPIAFAGESLKDKVSRLTAKMKECGADIAVMTNLDSIAWLLNIRGGDIPCVPVALSYALLFSNGSIHLFIDPRKVSNALRQELGQDVTFYQYEDFGSHLTDLKSKRVMFDPQTAPIKVKQNLEQAEAILIKDRDICLIPKACKNENEQEGARKCHIRDGVALTKTLCWLDENISKQSITEIDVVKKLLKLRQEQKNFKDVSFDTISGAGENGAIIHYRVSPQTNRAINPEDVYLLDSGGQYLDGTTDVTRTVAFQEQNQEIREMFTRVLKGHIALASALFPKGTTGSQLDALARQYLWEVGKDYKHGTGHGVGSYLSVHEGPQRISNVANATPLMPGMIVSNEPGYYKAGFYGIRIENLVIVQEVEVKDSEEKMYGFETITMVPICRDLIEVSLLSAKEKDWLNSYHETVRSCLTPLLDPKTSEWLSKATAPI